MVSYASLFQPLKIKGLTIRNRVFSTGHAPMYNRDGLPTERYIRYHQEKAKGGIGLTIFGGASGVSPDAFASYWSNLGVMDDSAIVPLRRIGDAIHEYGAAAMIQLTHLGRKMTWDSGGWVPPIGPSLIRDNIHTDVFPKIAEDWDIRRAQNDYAQAVRRVREAGLDGCEILMAQQHLIDQFWSPEINKRTDDYGGSLENRMRFGIETLRKIREVVGDDFVVGARISGDEFRKNGLSHEDLVEIARAYTDTGLIDFINVAGANASNHYGRGQNVPNMSYPVAPYLSLASAMRKAVSVPIFHAGRLHDLATAARALEEGHVDMVGMTRPHIADPYIMKKLSEGREDQIRECVSAAYCIDRANVGSDALCIQNAATGREETIPHIITKGRDRRRVVVVGGGPGGLEAARVAAERGHEVTLFEATKRFGGQLNVAAVAPWRQSLSGITRWLDSQIQRLGVDVRMDSTATAESVRALMPDVVIIATGGRPNRTGFNGIEMTVSGWDILTGKVVPAKEVLVFDYHGGPQGASLVEFMAKQGSLVELVTPDRMAAKHTGDTNFPVHLRELYSNNVIMTPDRMVSEVYGEGNRMVAVLTSEYGGPEEEMVVDQVVVEQGTVPADELYFDLKPGSTNLGEIDLRSFAQDGNPGNILNNPDGGYRLYRIGDAVASRNIHAAIYDGLRIANAL